MVIFFFHVIIFIFACLPSYGDNYLRPELFGAIGNGLVDDTKALQLALDTKRPLILDGTYLVNKKIYIYNNIEGSGKILVGRNDVSLCCSSDGISINGLVFDYQQYEGKLLRLNGVSNISIEGCDFLNVGNHNAKQSVGMILISGGSTFIRIRNCRFMHCLASNESSSAGVWVNFSKADDKCQHIYVEQCYFDDFQPSRDADAVKILGQNEKVFVDVTRCEFRRCNKRALKFQARECHSRDNIVYVTRPMYCAIDFQRGYGSSFNDSIIIENDTLTSGSNDACLLYRGICIAQGNVSVSRLNVLNYNSSRNSHQIAICIQSFNNYDDGSVDHVIFDQCVFKGMPSLITASESVSSISNIKFTRNIFNSREFNKSINSIYNQCKLTLKKYLEM